jgi:hypothetical protein
MNAFRDAKGQPASKTDAGRNESALYAILGFRLKLLSVNAH